MATRPATPDRTAPRMAALAFVSQNLTMAALYAPFSVLLMAVEARYHVSRQASSLGMALMSASLAISAPMVGVLAERVAARRLMMLGGLLSMLGYGLLALSSQHAVYLLVYALLFGPAICLSGVIVPSALVTRWYADHRGRALGIVHMPLLMGPLAMFVTGLLRARGLTATYGLLAGMGFLTMLAAAFVVERPAETGAPQSSADIPEAPAAAIAPLRSLILDRRFGLITVAFAACIAGNMVWGAHVIPMARGWGISAERAATLIMATSVAGIIGNPTLGWLFDRLGARRTITLVCLDCALLWGLLLLHPGYPALLALAFAFGLHGGATMAIFSGAVSEFFGRAAFSRTFGLSKLLTLPFTLLTIPAAAALYMRTGTYAAAVATQAAFFAIAGLALAAGAGKRSLPLRRYAETME